MATARATAPPPEAISASMDAASDPLDPHLLRAAVQGDRTAQGALARAYYPRMRRWALLETGDPTLAEDAVQDALVRWVRYAHSCNPDRPFEPWLRTLVRNAARDRRQARRGLLRWLPWSRGESRPAPGPSPDRQVELSRSTHRVLAALQQLTERQRALVDLCDVQGLRAVEAADRLDITPNTARVHLHEGRKRLKTLLGTSLRDILEAK